MKKLILISLICLTSIVVNAQKFAYVDSDYILERVPEYGSAQDQLDKLSLNWQEEIEELYQQIDQLYKKYQADKVLLTQEMKNKRESEIINKEKDGFVDLLLLLSPALNIWRMPILFLIAGMAFIFHH